MSARFRHRRRLRPWALVLILLLSAPPAQAADLEQRIKAAFLYNVAKFVTWPRNTAGNDDSSIDICILQDPAFAAVVQQELVDKRIGNARVLTHGIDAASPEQDCQILFVSTQSRPAETGRSLAQYREQPVLTVGDPATFLADGGIMRLKREDGKLRFEIDLRSLERSGLQVSSKLLRLADIVTGPAPDRR